jgi:Kef-type K+ transport system membrane component KefB
MTHDFGRLLLSLAVLLAAAVGGGQLARRQGLPAVLGEIAAGVCLGPTLLGRLLPSLSVHLFPADGPIATARTAMITAALVGFLFAAGLEVDLERLRERVLTMLVVGSFGIAVPFGLGYLLVVWRPALFAEIRDHSILALFMGTALSISALPVIARILMDLGLYTSSIGTLALSVAMVDDVVGWSLFAYLSRGTTGEGPWRSLTAVSALVLATLILGRAAVIRARPWIRRLVPDVAPRLGIAAALTFASAALAAGLGVHAVFGGFLAGILLSQGQSTRTSTRSVTPSPRASWHRSISSALVFVSTCSDTSIHSSRSWSSPSPA